MANSVQISPAKRGDANELSAIDAIAHREDKEWAPRSKPNFVRIISSSKKRIFLAKSKGKIIGYVHVVLKNGARGKYIWVEDIYVGKKYRKRGIGKMLISYAVGLKDKKTERVSLLTFNRNVKIFKKMGFKRVMNYMSLYLKKK